MDTSNLTALIIFLVVVVGLGATVVYYFARFYFKDPHDKESLPSPKPDPIIPPKDSVNEPKPESVAAVPAVSETQTHEIQTESEYVPEPAPASEPELATESVPEPSLAPDSDAPSKSLHSALSKTRESFFGRIKNVFVGGKKLDDEVLESLEEVLYTSDLGPMTVQRLLDAVDEKLSGKEKSEIEAVKSALKNEMLDIFSDFEIFDDVPKALRLENKKSPTVWMVVGVNGAGKTTTIGKLSKIVSDAGQKVMVVAGDTFRAAAGDQLKVWSERAEVEIFAPEDIKDPSAVAFDGCSSAKSKGFDVVIIDTAGRLHTQSNLMEELKKMKRVIQKVIPEAPHETFIVLDANSGQNALVQAKTFNESLELTGAILTKLDGSAKGGVALGLANELQLPIRLIGVGEGINDIRPFASTEFVDSILG